MLTAALLLALAPGPTAAACPSPEEAGLRLGARTAPVQVEAFLDPSSPHTWRAWLELRRVIADSAGEAEIRVHWAGTDDARRPRIDRVRAFVAALAMRGHTGPVLRAVARDGLDRFHARLVDPASHEALGQELGVPTATVAEALADRCARTAVQQSTQRLRQLSVADSSAVLRLPSFVIDRLTFEDGPALERLRPEIGQAAQRRRTYEVPPPPGQTPAVQATSDRMQRPRLRGLLLGGPGLPHRFVVMARGEDDPTLYVVLPPVLAQRHLRPGHMAVHVVSRGASSAAELLRHRLCAAQSLGLGSAYTDYLARDALLRQGSSPIDERLLAELDAVDRSECADDPDPVDLDLPDGAWLDGLPRSRAELSTLDGTLQLLDAAWRPLDGLLVGPKDGL